MNSNIIMLDPHNPPTAFEDIDVVYTDLDGTLFAPGGTITTDHAGSFSVEGLRMFNALRSAGIEIVITTGRSRNQLSEIGKVLKISTLIGELGGFSQYGIGLHADLHFHTGDWKDLPEGETPAHFSEANGSIGRLIDAFPGRLQRLAVDITNKREVSVLVIGIMDIVEARKLVGQGDYPLDIIDNGEILIRATELDVTEGIHIYHVLPRGISKGNAIEIDQAARAIPRKHTVSIGDSCGDISMAQSTEHFVMVENALSAPEVVAALDTFETPVYIAPGRTIDGWVNFAKTLLAAKGIAL